MNYAPEAVCATICFDGHRWAMLVAKILALTRPLATRKSCPRAQCGAWRAEDLSLTGKRSLGLGHCARRYRTLTAGNSASREEPDTTADEVELRDQARQRHTSISARPLPQLPPRAKSQRRIQQDGAMNDRARALALPATSPLSVYRSERRARRAA